MKFHQFIEYNTKNIFLEKPFTERGEKTSPRPFSEKLNLNIFLDQQSKILYCIPSWGLSKYIETKLQTACLYLKLSFFSK